jgi:co-chaperonin GroES (HSP10)
MQKKLMGLFLISLMLLASCAPHVHTVGKGAQGSGSMTQREIYVINLVPLKNVQSKDLAGSAEDYTITTQHDVLGIVIAIVTLGILSSRTVTVDK